MQRCSAARIRELCNCTLLTLLTCRSVNCKRSRYGVGRVIPATVEAHSVVAAAGWDAAVVAKVGDSHVRTALGHAAVPELRNGLSVGKGPSQTPVRDCRRSSIVDRDRRAEPARPLVCDGVANVTSKAGLRNGNRQWNRSRGGQTARRAGDGDSGRSCSRRTTSR